jgi:hypothetical protein
LIAQALASNVATTHSNPNDKNIFPRKSLTEQPNVGSQNFFFPECGELFPPLVPHFIRRHFEKYL